jgi:hypothetical protein
VSYPEKITKNLAFNRFQSLSVEIIEEKNRQKVIHSQFISPCFSPRNPPLWTDSGCPDKYVKTQCNKRKRMI